MFRIVGALILVPVVVLFAVGALLAGVIEWLDRGWREWNDPSDEEGWW